MRSTPGGICEPGPDAAAAARDSTFVGALRAQLAAATAASQFSGAVLLARDGQTVFEGANGLADRERRVPNTPLTQFRVASMYKMMTAVATLQLVQAGTLRLDAPLGTYLPDYANAEVTSKVTLHHLLTHTGGTGDILGPLFTAHRGELRSNYGFMLLDAVIERTGGKSYDDHVATRVLAPAGMTATGALSGGSVRDCIPLTNHTGHPCVNVLPSAHVVSRVAYAGVPADRLRLRRFRSPVSRFCFPVAESRLRRRRSSLLRLRRLLRSRRSRSPVLRWRGWGRTIRSSPI